MIPGPSRHNDLDAENERYNFRHFYYTLFVWITEFPLPPTILRRFGDERPQNACN